MIKLGVVSEFSKQVIIMKKALLIVLLFQTTILAVEKNEVEITFNEQKFALITQAQDSEEQAISESI